MRKINDPSSQKLRNGQEGIKMPDLYDQEKDIQHPEEETSKDNGASIVEEPQSEQEKTGVVGKIGEKVHDHPYLTSAALMGTALAAGTAANQSGTVHEVVDPALERVGIHVPTEQQHIQEIRDQKSTDYDLLLKDRARDSVGQEAWNNMSVADRLQLQIEEDKKIGQELSANEGAPYIKSDEKGQVAEVGFSGQAFAYDNPNEQKDNTLLK